VAQALVFAPRTLADRTAVSLRPIRPDDVPALQALHARLSPETIYWRYLGVHPVLATAEAERLTHVDCENCVAFVTTCTENSQEDIVGVARYERLGAGHADEAEFTIVVEDRFQRRGIGTLLWRQLTAQARAHGIRLFVAVIHPENQRMWRFMRRSGLKMDTKLYGGVMTARVYL
jgi:RimJ/RimL family protein N-acetyltransferase